MDERRVYVPIIGRDELCCIVCHIDPNEVDNSVAKSFFHWQTLKCRFLLNLMQDDVIGSPVPGNDRCIHIITTKDFYQDGTLSTMFKRINLTVSKPIEVTLRTYNCCIKYMFEFILAPKWNRVHNQLFIRGREFLTSTDCNPAININLSLLTNWNSDENYEIMMKLMPFNVKLFPLKLRDFYLPQSVIADFMNSSIRGTINVAQFKVIRVSVLPSMRKGRLISVYKKIPDICPFKNWADLRRHWKIMYGYRLPETDEDILFYEISFPFAGSRIGNNFVYPDICVREEISKLPYKNDVMQITNEFMNDLVGIMPKMCSRELKFNEKSLKDTSNVTFATLQAEPSKPINQPIDNEYLEKIDQLQSLTNENNGLKNRQTTLMSSAPSLIGKRTNTTFNFDNLKKIKKIHESKVPIKYQSELLHNNFEPIHPTKASTISFNSSTTTHIPKITENKAPSINIFSPAASFKKQNPPYKMPILSKFTKQSATNQENIPRLSQVKKQL